MVNNQNLLDIVNERIEQLTTEIQAELQSITPILNQEYLPLVRKVFQKVSDLGIWKCGNSKYISVYESSNQSSRSNWVDTQVLDYVNLNFRATPYSPVHKMVEIATKNKYCI